MVVDQRAWGQFLQAGDAENAREPELIASSLHQQVVHRPAFPGRRWVPTDGLPKGLRKGDRFRFVATFPSVLPGEHRDKLVFPVSQDVSEERREIAWLVMRVTPPLPRNQPQDLGSAVAVAGRTAVAGERPRAVVLVLSDDPRDLGMFAPENVRGYLEKLRVPLHVWRTSEPAASGGWGPEALIATPAQLKRALKSLRADLDRQYMVWLQGSHLPQDVELRHPGWKIAG